MRSKLSTKPLAFLDIETTGLDHVRYDLIEVAIIRTNATPFQTKVKPTLVAPPNARACEVNGYNDRDWKDAPLWNEVAREVHARLKGAVIVAHNLQGFDWPWMRHYFSCYNTANGDGRTKILPDLRGPFVDTMALAYAILVPRGLERLSLAACCEFCGVPPEGVHRALGGAQRCKAIYDHMLEISGEAKP